MDALRLLDRAREAGLAIATAGDKLIVRGPRQAEPVVRLLAANKGQILAALADAKDWQSRHWEAVSHWNALHDKDTATRLAWGEMLLGGTDCMAHAWQCAGCEGPIGGLPTLHLSDGNRVHLDTLDYLIGYGARWRGAAMDALAIMGLEPPAGEGEP